MAVTGMSVGVWLWYDYLLVRGVDTCLTYRHIVPYALDRGKMVAGCTNRLTNRLAFIIIVVIVTNLRHPTQPQDP